MLEEKVKKIQAEAAQAMASCENSKSLYDEKVKYLGKQGAFSKIMREMGQLDKAERPKFGALVNEVKRELETIYEARELELKKAELKGKIENERLDLSLPGPLSPLGSAHPISLVIDEIVDILSRVGYSVRTGPLIEHDKYNFEALNIPADHPARDLQDTFYIDDQHVLRTHTSPIQIHTMENEAPPLRILAPGSVFRCDSDISHSPNFHQIEGMLVDRKVSMADLKGTISYFVQEFFGKGLETRFRPSFFPFTEPSAEVDCSCPICRGSGCRMCKHTGWVEIGGSGLINPKVLQFSGIDPKEWQGFAFGFGIERMAIIKYGIDDIRLFSENDIRFLRQF
ncbi:MAG: phenylalanine--tRNA ligase subunit alpha [Pseudobdellovibrionaceae bacterium]|nr:phenylalanine--tRNA ligase subunit alpha [Bdellovibrionales bacterium]USN48921.1 MAG: phenylalanine--tRNA ligase subunit alpha [Pseudobdellovibrionaceae bacterium]